MADNSMRFASVQHALNSIPDELYWVIGKGKTRPDEPLYGIQIMDKKRNIVAEAEDDSLIEAIKSALRDVHQ
jgi:hypothetical protein